MWNILVFASMDYFLSLTWIRFSSFTTCLITFYCILDIVCIKTVMTKVKHYFSTEKSCPFFCQRANLVNWVNLIQYQAVFRHFCRFIFSSPLTSNYLIMGSGISLQLYLGILAPVILWRFLCNSHPASSFLNHGPSLF